MKTRQCIILLLSLSLLGPASAWAVEAPVAVSPGSDEGQAVAAIGDTCPTFSWGAADGAVAYSVAVYKAPSAEGDTPVIDIIIDAEALSWTPSAAECLAAGNRYEWYVGATGAAGEEAWSAPKLFNVTADAVAAAAGEVSAQLVNNEVLSQHIREADGTSGQDTNSGAGIKTRHLQDSAVTSTKIKNFSVKTWDLGPQSVTTGKIRDGTIATVDIAAGAVTTGKIASGAVTDAKITGPISGAKLGTHSHSGADITSGSVAVVASSGGNYTTPTSAMSDLASWCGTPSATNPCLLKILPGVYNIGTSSLQMREYVDIEGSGENTTKITGNIDSSTAGIVNGASNAEIRFLSIENTGGGAYAYAIYNNTASPKITSVAAHASGSTSSRGVYNYYSSPTMFDVTATASGANSFGIFSFFSSPHMTGVTASASGGGIGIQNYRSSPIMSGVTATSSGGFAGIINSQCPSVIMIGVVVTVSGGTTSSGIRNEGTVANPTTATMSEVTVWVSSGTNNYGVYNYLSFTRMNNCNISAEGGSSENVGIHNSAPSSAYSVHVHNSRLKGSTAAIRVSGYSTHIGGSFLDGGTVNLGGTGILECAGVYDEDYTFYPSTCP
jgi:hypothetical protein